LGSSTDVLNLHRIDNQDWDSILDNMEEETHSVLDYMDKLDAQLDLEFDIEFDEDMDILREVISDSVVQPDYFIDDILDNIEIPDSVFNSVEAPSLIYKDLLTELYYCRW